MKKFLLLFVLCAISLPLQADPISFQQAKAIAENHFKQHNLKHTDQALYAKAAVRVKNNPAFFVFNAEGIPAFVIVSGDDRVMPILGYSNTSNFDADNVPTNVQWLLENYARQINNLGNITVSPADASSNCSPIEPLIQTQWDQVDPYNRLCPVYNGQRCVTGCTNTALAQVLRYYQWPEQNTKPIPAYTTETLGIFLPELPVSSLEISQIPIHVTSSSSTAEITRLARLMLYVGQCLEADYGPSLTWTSYWAEPFKEYFGYRSEAFGVFREDYDDQTWLGMVYEELWSGRPVVYSGSNDNGDGHVFICDGYDGHGKFHVNWGWSGQYNGYFTLDNLDPHYYDPFYKDHYALFSFAPITPFNGEKFEVGIKSYQVCEEQGTNVKLIRGLHPYNDEKLVINSSVSYLGIDYDVITVAQGAFQNCSSLKEISIPESITDIENYAFAGCSALKKVTVRHHNPLIINNSVFQGVDLNNCTLVVPKGSLNIFRNHDIWKQFGNIIEASSTNPTGDVNSDGKVDIADVNAVINTMLGKSGGNADITGDGSVDIADVNLVMNIMLGKIEPQEPLGGLVLSTNSVRGQ